MQPQVQAVKDDLLARRGKTARNIAKVAAAHRMLDVVFYVLRDGHARLLDQPASGMSPSPRRHADRVAA